MSRSPFSHAPASLGTYRSVVIQHQPQLLTNQTLPLSQHVSDNLRKWSAAGADVNKLLPSASPVLIAPIQAPEVVAVERTEARAPQDQSVQKQLALLTRNITEAREEQLFHKTAPKGGRGGGGAPFWAQKKKRGRDEEEEPEGTSSSRLREPTVAPLPSAARATAAPAAAPKSKGAPPPGRTLFQIGPSSHSPALPVVVAAAQYESIEDCGALLDSIREVIDDDSRIQAPQIGIALFTTDSHSNFSLSAGLSQTNSFMSLHAISSRAQILKAISAFIFCWKEKVFVVTNLAAALKFIAEVSSEHREVEWITFYASAILMPILAHGFTAPDQRPKFHFDNVSDVRVMAWMLNPSDHCPSDFDHLLRMHGNGLALSSSPMPTLQGTCDRLLQNIQVYRRLYGALGSRGLLQSFLRQEKSVTIVCAIMKFEGFLVNISQLDSFKKKVQADIARLQQEALAFVQPSMVTFNLQSPDDCRQALYDVLQLDRHLTGTDCATTKGGKLSTAEETLKLLSPYHALPQTILSFRKLAKLLQTYVEGILESAALLPDSYFKEVGGVHQVDFDNVAVDDYLLHEGDGLDKLLAERASWQAELRRVHCTFSQEGTDTGRLSCFDPNLQNLPRTNATNSDDEIFGASNFIRNCFVPVPGCVLVTLDYEQIELRILAHLCGDLALVSSLSRDSHDAGGDIHRNIAAVIFKRASIGEVTKEERTQAKRAVFGVLYGMGPRALAQQINESYEFAAQIMSNFKASFPQIDRYISRVVAQCRQDSFIRTIAGRIRHLPDINDSNSTKRSLAERQAFNTVIQGSAADVVKKAMNVVYNDVLKSFSGRVRLHCQIHDELVFSIPKELVDDVIPRIMAAMTGCMSLLVPLRVSVNIGESFGALRPYNESK